jgi:manganese efflux pump family protein
MKTVEAFILSLALLIRKDGLFNNFCHCGRTLFRHLCCFYIGRFALVLAFFQGGLTVGGYFLGTFISGILKAFDHWVALILLSVLGVKMILEGLKSNEEKEEKDYTSALLLMTLALGTSIDAFAVGISLALLDVEIWSSGIIIGAVTFLASMAAIRIGKSAGPKLGNRVEIVGGLILIAIGLKIFLEHII